MATVHEKAASGPASADAGKELATRYGCIACHSVDGATVGHSGPTWKGLLGEKRTFKDGTSLTADEAYIRESILDPAKKIVKGYELGMGSYAGVLSDTDIDSLILYIKSLK
ncbi:MAG: cytochrome c [Luteolibacter sp.]